MSKPHGEWPPPGIPIIEPPSGGARDGDLVSQPAEVITFTPDWYEASPLVKEWVDELCELAAVDPITVEQITVTFHIHPKPKPL